MSAHREGRERDHARALVFLYDFQLACHQRNTDVHEVCRDARLEASEVADDASPPAAVTLPASKRTVN